MGRISLLGALLLLCLPADAQESSHPIMVRFVTSAGAFVVSLDSVSAPVTATNFLRYVDGGHYRGGSFFRTVTRHNQERSPVKIEVIQAGIHPWRENDAFDPIPLERTGTTGLRHTEGTISMARGEPNSATWSFFICIGDQPELDEGGSRNPDGQGFAAFGRVTEGMDVVRKIQGASAEGQALVPPILIVECKRLP